MNLPRIGSPFALGMLLASQAFSGRAFAQTPAPGSTKAAPAASGAAAPTAMNAPDIVRLKNGGILRGTISELEPGDSVTIVLITGETRKIPFSQVQQAGPASEPANAAPAAPAPAVAATSASAATTKKETQPFAVVHADESRINVVSDPAGLTLFRRAASAGFSGVGTVSGYDEVCTAPCDVSMPAGTHTFAVAKPGGKPREADAVTLPAGNATMSVANVDRTGIRIGMGVVGAAVMVGGFALILTNTGSNSSDSYEPPSTGKLVGGAVLGGVGAGLLALAFTIPDGTEITVTPGAPVASGTKASRQANSRWLNERRPDANALRDQLSGLTVTARF